MNISDRACELAVETKSGSLIGTVALGGIAIVILNLRLASRSVLQGKLQADDWVMIVVDVSCQLPISH
jgi:hypothetical protein